MNDTTLDPRAQAMPGEHGASALRQRDGAMSPRAKARLAGVFELLEGTASASGQVAILGSLFVQDNVAATAHNILANESLFRLGFALSVAGVGFHLAWGLLIYQLLKPVNKTVSTLAAFIVIITSAMQALTALLYLGPLVVLQVGQSMSGLSSEQAQALAYVLIKLNTAAFQLDLVFFGAWCMLTGYLIWKSKFLPRIFGALLALDGFGWALYVWPPLATFLFPAIAAVSALAEIPIPLWLIAMGVNDKRWTEQARAAGMPNPEWK
jgi:hypothetical protein